MSAPGFPDNPLDDLPKIIAGKYQIDAQLGRGGMGVVFAARHTQLNHEVAIKILARDVSKDAVAAARFIREAKMALAIQSEHVVRVMDMGTLDSGALYMVMERLIGEDLDTTIARRGRLPMPEAVDYVLQASEAIAEAHAHGIVHRDLKPANLFRTVRPDGSALIKVLDFGISKLKTNPVDGALTSTASLLGSPMYMSPEQIRDSKAVDERTDIWSLGVILYEFLSGNRPFKGDTLGAIHAAILVDRPQSLAELLPDLPTPLIQTVEACLEKEAAKRTSSVAELARALRPFAVRRSLNSVERIVAISKTGVHTPAAFERTDAERHSSRPPPRSPSTPAVEPHPSPHATPVARSTPPTRHGFSSTPQPASKVSSRLVASIAGGVLLIGTAGLAIGWRAMQTPPVEKDPAHSAIVAPASETPVTSAGATASASATPPSDIRSAEPAPPSTVAPTSCAAATTATPIAHRVTGRPAGSAHASATTSTRAAPPSSNTHSGPLDGRK